MPKLFGLCIAVFFAVFVVGAFAFAQDSNSKDEKKKPKYTVKQVMAKAMAPKGDKLNKKVLSGTASAEEKLALLDLYLSLGENEPPKGDADSWKKFAGMATMAAAKVAVGRDGAIEELKAATNCKKCHDAHKPAAKKKK